VDDPTKHVIHREWCEVTPAAVDAIRVTKAKGGRVVAVGTTTTRTLESAALASSLTSPRRGRSARLCEPGGGEGIETREGAHPPLAGEAPATSPSRGEVRISPFCGETGLFIHAPFDFRVVDALVTNFHLPRTTLLLLVGALAGSDLLREAYSEAVAKEYRFFSYGDAMLVL